MHLVDREAEGALARVGAAALVVEQVQDAIGRRLQYGKARRVVKPRCIRAHELEKERLRNALEDVGEELGVQFLIGEVDAELLE